MMPTAVFAEHPQAVDTDASHEALAEVIADLIGASNAAFPVRFQTLLTLFRMHVAEEGGLMRASRYPGIAEHDGDHHRILGELVQLNLAIRRGRIALARAYVKAGWARWFHLHLATLDGARAAHLRRAPQPN
jgi:hemerythrin